MKCYVNTYNEIIGFHYYPDAPEFCSYLSNTHRHVFIIRCSVEVSNKNREIEINELQLSIEEYLKSAFGYPCQFGYLSCEMIAEFLMQHFQKFSSVQVLEDGYGGATLTR